LTLRFSPLACALTNSAFTLAMQEGHIHNLRPYFLAIAIITGLFVLAPFAECLRRAIHNPRLTFTAFVAGSAVCNYYWLMNTLWSLMCGWTTKMVYAILHFCGANVNVKATIHNHQFQLASPYFNIVIYPPCNGLEGIFLFVFMLSVLFIFDWRYFADRSILRLYIGGIAYMFIVNALRISAFFTLGYWAYNPGAWEWVRAFQAAPLVLFHTYAGWVVYLGAFCAFVNYLYAKPHRQLSASPLCNG
jgi:exosortase/archaeosortase family protein